MKNLLSRLFLILTIDKNGRSRRSLRENFIVPGTKWCGAGQLAERYTELGSDMHEDRCCRAHDHCRANIGAFKRRFGYFNLRPFTISHCRCDRRLVFLVFLSSFRSGCFFVHCTFWVFFRSFIVSALSRSRCV